MVAFSLSADARGYYVLPQGGPDASRVDAGSVEELRGPHRSARTAVLCVPIGTRIPHINDPRLAARAQGAERHA